MKLAISILPALFLLSACSSKTDNAELMNTEAALPAAFNLTKMGLKVITSGINPQQATMFTLYGNNKALQLLKEGRTVAADETFALITWKQQADKNWFGARIPGPLHRLEMIKTSAATNGAATGKPQISYQRFEGPHLVLNKDTTGNAERISYIFAQQPSVMP